MDAPEPVVCPERIARDVEVSQGGDVDTHRLRGRARVRGDIVPRLLIEESVRHRRGWDETQQDDGEQNVSMARRTQRGSPNPSSITKGRQYT